MVSRRRTSPAGLLGPQGQRRPSRTPNPRTRLSPHTAVEEHDGGDGDQCREPACAGGPRGALLRSADVWVLAALEPAPAVLPFSLAGELGAADRVLARPQPARPNRASTGGLPEAPLLAG